MRDWVIGTIITRYITPCTVADKHSQPISTLPHNRVSTDTSIIIIIIIIITVCLCLTTASGKWGERRSALVYLSFQPCFISCRRPYCCRCFSPRPVWPRWRHTVVKIIVKVVASRWNLRRDSSTSLILVKPVRRSFDSVFSARSRRAGYDLTARSTQFTRWAFMQTGQRIFKFSNVLVLYFF